MSRRGTERRIQLTIHYLAFAVMHGCRGTWKGSRGTSYPRPPSAIMLRDSEDRAGIGWDPDAAR